MTASSLPISSTMHALTGEQNMTAYAGTALPISPPTPSSPTVPATPVLRERWPSLARAMGQYERRVADEFSQKAYACVAGGIIRLDERRQLAKAAEQVGIRPFDAQLLIACAVRQWALDHRYDPTPSPDAPQLSFEYKAWGKVWVRLGLLAGLAVAAEAVMVWNWLA